MVVKDIKTDGIQIDIGVYNGYRKKLRQFTFCISKATLDATTDDVVDIMLPHIGYELKRLIK